MQISLAKWQLTTPCIVFTILFTVSYVNGISWSYDEESFRALMQEQKKRAREARANIDAGWAGDALGMIDKSKATEFVGYTENECACNIEYIIANGEDVGVLAGGKATIIT